MTERLRVPSDFESAMGNCMPDRGRKRTKNPPGSVLDRVISQASSQDDCLLYKLANYKGAGELVDAYSIGGSKEVENLIEEQFGIFLYEQGQGTVIDKQEYLKWCNRTGSAQCLDGVTLTLEDDRDDWEDHEACWKMEYRGSLGESLLHVLIMCNTRVHTRLARLLLKVFPKLSVDVVEGDEYLGASALHLAIAYNNHDLATLLVECGAKVNQRAIGSFFLPYDQQRDKKRRKPDASNYEGLAYFGEYPLVWAACCFNEALYNYLLDRGGDPNLQDSLGNMTLHILVVNDKLVRISLITFEPSDEKNI
ncbi:unnamed protein product [Darwinula stevensoni]|uniref:Uncharacterized protein n=1 Tax=Darwinula stevensoni TaxID=69355 RepID=A0A7R9A8T2_9CRUS|nr:unnamed protein product [Darwinula stevensoni]CAG0896718.1 unnamed protein product [Darwinula stevensoni]